MKSWKALAIIGPGILVAATGVGAGDLATGAFTGQKLGVAILWAVAAGALLKYVINEGLARWQLATGDTLLEGCVTHIGRPFQWVFVVYLAVWSFFVGAALISACGVTMHAMAPLVSPQTDKIIYGILHSAVALLLVRLGGFPLFEKVMTVCIGIMFVVVVATAVALHPPLGEVGRGLFVPTIPQFHDGGLGWTVALLGGVGGTVTVLCYGYWIREQGREGADSMRVCRLDLATAYVMTALFGMAMVVIGSRLPAVKGGGATLLADLADSLRQALGRAGTLARWAFLFGAWGAVFSSLLGVWQSVPYLFTDFWNLATARQADPKPRVDTASRAYRGALYGLATVPIIGLWLSSFQTAQKSYAIVGALIIPALAAVLLYLNNRVSLVGPIYRSGWKANSTLVVALIFFLYAGWMTIRYKL